MALDRTDLKILGELGRDGRISNQDLAARVALSPSSCLRRVRMLEEAGIISGYRCEIDPQRLGLEVQALVQVSMRQDVEQWHEKFVESVLNWPEVIAATIVTGQSNYILTVRARDLSHYAEFIVNRLYKTPGVMAINSNMVLGTIKSGGSLLGLLEGQE
jgi:Lrp/AsnC family transcriptional regulator, leucine-responsive regulatory protein